MSAETAGRPEATPALILTNVACLERHGLTVDDLVRLSAGAGLDAEILPTAERLSPNELAERLARRPARLVVAGGDGTVHHTVNALAPADPMAPIRPPIGILPLGTANDFARSLGLPADFAAALRVVAQGHARPTDLGWVDGARFLNAVHIGSLAETTRRVNPWLKRGIRGGAYALAVASTAWRIRPFQAEWTCGDETAGTRAFHIAVANGRYFGGGMPISNEATLEDGRLDLAILPALPPGWLGRLTGGLLRGRGLQLPGVMRLRGAAVTMTLSGAPPMSLDGEHFEAESPLSFRVLPRAMAVYVPAVT